MLPQGRDHFFLAIRPDDSTAERIGQLASRLRISMGSGRGQLSNDRLHVTLHSLGRYIGVPEQMVNAARSAAAAAVTGMPAFQVAFDRAVSFARNADDHPYVALFDHRDNAALMKFQWRLGEELDKRHVPRVRHSKFTPHMTLLYSEQNEAEESVEPVSWTVNEIVLIHSIVGKAIHIRLDYWPLRGQA